MYMQFNQKVRPLDDLLCKIDVHSPFTVCSPIIVFVLQIFARMSGNRVNIIIVLHVVTSFREILVDTYRVNKSPCVRIFVVVIYLWSANR